jgi:hypothetical protein
VRQLALVLLILAVILSGCTPGTGAMATPPLAPTSPPAVATFSSQELQQLMATATPKPPKATATATSVVPTATKATAPTQPPAATKAAAPPTEQVQPVAPAQPASDTVYITDTGKKYHRDGCSSLAKSKIPISRADAIARGYGPCGNCHP